MKLTEKFFNLVQQYQERLGVFSAIAKEQRDRIEDFKGSKAYDELLQAYNADFAKDLEEIRDNFRPKFGAVISDMRKAVEKRKLVPPTEEQLRTLNALKMMDKPSDEWLRMAAKSMMGCDIALAVLDDIRGHDKAPIFNTATSSVELLHRIDQLEQGTWALFRATTTDCTYTPGVTTIDQIGTNRVLRPPQDVKDCMGLFGGVSDYDAFSSVVDA